MKATNIMVLALFVILNAFSNKNEFQITIEANRTS